MLIYHPAFDAYHTVFRMIAITDTLRRLEFSKLRILDFYLCFPAELAKARLPSEHSGIKKFARATQNAYRGPVSAVRTFRDMHPLQIAAARLIAASALFVPQELEVGMVVRTELSLPDGFLQSLRGFTAAQNEAAKYVLTQMSEIPLHGIGGLKDRTGLLEFRYDPS